MNNPRINAVLFLNRSRRCFGPSSVQLRTKALDLLTRAGFLREPWPTEWHTSGGALPHSIVTALGRWALFADGARVRQ